MNFFFGFSQQLFISIIKDNLMLEIRRVLKHALIPIHNPIAIIMSQNKIQRYCSDHQYGWRSWHKKPFMVHLNLKLKAIFQSWIFTFPPFKCQNEVVTYILFQQTRAFFSWKCYCLLVMLTLQNLRHFSDNVRWPSEELTIWGATW